MALSEKKALTDKKHLDKLDKMKIQPYKEEGAEIRAAAKQAGQSLQGYILQAVRTRMEMDAELAGDVKNIEVDSSAEDDGSCVISPTIRKLIGEMVGDAVHKVKPNQFQKLRTEIIDIVNESWKSETERAISNGNE